MWTPLSALPPLLSTILSIIYTLYILAYPPRHRRLAFAILCVPVLHAFTHHMQLTPWFAINDTFGRMLYIWIVYVSFAFLIVGVDPVGQEECEGSGVEEERKRDDVCGWRSRRRRKTRRMRWAGKILYTRYLGEYYCAPRLGGARLSTRREPPHGLNRVRFCLHHVGNVVLSLFITWLWGLCIDTPSFYSSCFLAFHPDHASFLRRLPRSLNTTEIRMRALMTWDTCIADMLHFSAIYSAFAVLWVCVLRLDSPDEWSLSLFGPLSSAYSVRRYWGVYWHDYISASFSGHVKVVTRRWLGWEEPSAARRVVENAAVFAVSGLMHSLVRYVQTEGNGEVWTIALWYGAQILPIVAEGVVQNLWRRLGLRVRARVWLGEVVVMRLERAVGRVWVFAWMFWSVPKYLLTRHAWEMESLRRKYPELFSGL